MYQNDFKYKATKALLHRLLHVKTSEALMWRRKARRYLDNFPYQWDNRNTLAWKIDTEVFERLQRDALTIELSMANNGS